MNGSTRRIVGALGILWLGMSCIPAWAEEQEDRIERLERMVEQLSEEVRSLRAEQDSAAEATKSIRSELRDDVEEEVESALADAALERGGFEIGGYGELHANLSQGEEKDILDIHRFVLDFGYAFEDWIQFRAELEVEHAFVSEGDGEISMEQFYTDFLLTDRFNVRVGRFLTPLGLINARHEPTSFNGVERPNVDKFIIPSTWSTDGVGLYGRLVDSLSYEVYVGSGLDGSKFSPTGGIRGGRIKERPSLNDIAVMGRLDYYPFVDFSAPLGQTLRLGLSGYTGGLENGDQGKNPDLSGTRLSMAVADFEYSIGRYDLRGEGAYQWIDDAEKLPMGVAKEMAGWYLEPAVHAMPESWKTGQLERSDAVLFLRYEDFDTQLKTVSGVARVPGGEREEWTTGINFYFTPGIVLKADYQFVESDAVSDPENRLNLGMGMQF